MSENFLTADLHLNHANIIGYCNRPFFYSSVSQSDIEWSQENNQRWHELVDVNKHDETLIENWNSVVTKKDQVWVIGDFAFVNEKKNYKYYSSRLNGKINFIRGNHDKTLSMLDRSLFNDVYFEAPTNKGFIINGEKYVLSHYPLMSWNARYHGRYHFFGHVHTSPTNPVYCMPNSYDVGVDNNMFKPIILEEAILKAKNNPNAIDFELWKDFVEWRKKDRFRDLEI